MIKIEQLTKTFDGFTALNKLDLNVKKGSIYGLVGVNGSGKTTIIKHLTGVYQQDSGRVCIDGTDVYDNENIKRKVGYIPDDLFFFSNYNMSAYKLFYSSLYSDWNEERYESLVKQFGLNQKRNLNKFSKGMQKQAAFTFVMSAMPQVLILDEPIDGLDPLVRKMVMKYIIDDVAEREMTVLVSSHNLKEMEGICDAIGIVEGGRMVIERDLDELKNDIHKIQVAFNPQTQAGVDKYSFDVLHFESRGSIELLVVKGKKETIEAQIAAMNPLVFDLLPLTLEEIFIYEMESGTNEQHIIL